MRVYFLILLLFKSLGKAGGLTCLSQASVRLPCCLYGFHQRGLSRMVALGLRALSPPHPPRQGNLSPFFSLPVRWPVDKASALGSCYQLFTSHSEMKSVTQLPLYMEASSSLRKLTVSK